MKKKVNLQKSQKLDFYLPLGTLRSRSLKVRGKGLQVLSRNTLTQEELKRVPAAFGDSINALTTLPGVIRTTPSGLFGTLIIRGANQFSNRYYIDDIPVLYPQHFGAIQSVISNELMAKIDLFSSSAPAYYGQSLGGVIDIRTKDKVKEPLGKLTVSLISLDSYFETRFGGENNSQKTTLGKCYTQYRQRLLR